MDIYERYTLEELKLMIKYINRFKKIINSSEILTKYYQSGHIQLYVRRGIPIVEVVRMIDVSDAEYMDKSTKDKIVNYLKKNGLGYIEKYDAYTFKMF
jgi:hypothetical protein